MSTLTVGGITDVTGSLDGLTLHWADNDWLAECRWRQAPFRDQVVPLNRPAHGHEGRGCFERSSQGSWSTGRHLPMGALTDLSGRAWLWQIESSAGWRFETGEREGAAYVALFGPDDAHHQWQHTLAPGEDFHTVPAVLVRGETGGLDAAFGELTDYRRLIRRDHPDHRALPVIYNDYMNTLMGDPTTDKLLPLVEAAGRAAPRSSSSTPGGTTTTPRAGGTPSAHGSPPGGVSPAASRRCWTRSGGTAWSRDCGWSPKSSACAARWPTPCRPRRSSGAAVCA